MCVLPHYFEAYDMKVSFMPLFMNLIGMTKSLVLRLSVFLYQSLQFYISWFIEPSTLNIDLIMWHTQLIVCVVKC